MLVGTAFCVELFRWKSVKIVIPETVLKCVQKKLLELKCDFFMKLEFALMKATLIILVLTIYTVPKMR